MHLVTVSSVRQAGKQESFSLHHGVKGHCKIMQGQFPKFNAQKSHFSSNIYIVFHGIDLSCVRKSHRLSILVLSLLEFGLFELTDSFCS